MSRKLITTFALAVLASLLLTNVAFARPLEPISKSLVEDPSRSGTAWMEAPAAAAEAGADLAAQTSVGTAFGGPFPAAGYWYLLNGAFDDDWDGNTPLFWKVHGGDADEYGSFPYENYDAEGITKDWGFAITIINNEVKGDHNAYLYQEIDLPAGNFWVDAHSAIYAYDSKTAADPYATQGGYSYMTYYALVPKSVVMASGGFDPSAISEDAWRELWMRSYVCSEGVKGGIFWPNACLYQQRAETVSAEGGEYVFVLRAELKWPDWRAAATYVFDDIQIIAADPALADWNACDGTFCVEGFLER